MTHDHHEDCAGTSCGSPSCLSCSPDATYTWEQVSARTGFDAVDLSALSSGLDHGPHLTEDGRVTEAGLQVLLAQADAPEEEDQFDDQGNRLTPSETEPQRTVRIEVTREERSYLLDGLTRMLVEGHNEAPAVRDLRDRLLRSQS